LSATEESDLVESLTGLQMDSNLEIGKNRAAARTGVSWHFQKVAVAGNMAYQDKACHSYSSVLPQVHSTSKSKKDLLGAYNLSKGLTR